MSNDEHLNNMLNKMEIPSPASNLAARIIDAATFEPKKQRPLWDRIIQEVMAMVILPRPAYAMALILLFAIILGLEIDMLTTQTSEDLFSFIDMTEEEGGWL